MPSRSRSTSRPLASRRIVLIGLVSLVVLTGFSLLAADWYIALPTETQATYVGRNSCVKCHQQEHETWTNSHHDLAMDVATDETVLGNFDDQTIEHYGITSRMFRRDGKFMINTEGADGQMADFEIKYVFGVEPLQQYMVEIDPPTPGSPPGSIGRVQVLRVSWNTHKGEWFYLSPPDVNEKLSPTDPLHWTGRTQNWNHYCADCHSTNLQKNFDLATQSFHTTFSEIDVSCETCHGPGSVHVDLANAPSLFWDRNLGYGLPKLKGKDKETQVRQVETCGQCHSRRQVVCPEQQMNDSYYDRFSNELLMPATYYCDGQIKDEDYVYGSFIQSKMFHKGIRCTDCHDPHSARVKFEGNLLCTSCHQHPAGKYDTPAHHFHSKDSTGASCVECHMPETTYMEVDARRDHSIRIPSPRLSVDLGTPNACTQCHLDRAKLPTEKHPGVQRYDQWMALASAGDEEVKNALAEVDRWTLDAIEKWYGPDDKNQKQHFAYHLSAAWQEEPDAEAGLKSVARDARVPGIARASATAFLRNYLSQDAAQTALRNLSDPDPQVRIAAIGVLQDLPQVDESVRADVFEALLRRLEDPDRAVRAEAAWALAGSDEQAISVRHKTEVYQRALKERIAALERDYDQPAAHLSMGVLYERIGDVDKAERAYRTAIAVGPDFTGPRSNLVNLLQERQDREEAQMRQLVMQRNRSAAEQMTSALASRAVEIARLRYEELMNLKRDVQLQPDFAPLRHQFGLAAFLAARQMPPDDAQPMFDEAYESLKKATELRPKNVQFAYMYTLLCQFLQRWKDADAAIAHLLALDPNNPQFQALAQQIRARQNPQK